MSEVQPFRGFVVRQHVAHDVVSPAYDALTSTQRQQHRAEHPNSYLHVTRSAEDEPDAATVDNATLVARGRSALEDIIAQDLFQSFDEPAFFVYRLAIGGHAQSGLVCEVPSQYYHSVAHAHEATRAERAELLAEHFTTVQAASSPVACTVQDDGSLEAALVAAADGEPVMDFTGEDGLQQTVWRVNDRAVEAQLADLLSDADLYIIDGHHRSRANLHLHERGITLPVLATIFPEQSLRLVGFHRLLKLPAGLSPAEFLRNVGRRFRVEITSDVTTVEPGRVAMVVDDQWHIVHFDERPIAGSAQVHLGALDPVVLEREILDTIVGLYGTPDVTYTPDTEPFREIVRAAHTEGRIPIMVPPVAVSDMMTVAAGGVIMPAKSTYFVPKVRSGVFLRLFEQIEEVT